MGKSNNKSKNGNKRYSIEFKTEAAKRVVEGKETSAAIARELGVNDHTIRSWVSTYKENDRQPFVGSGNLRDIEAENKQLKKELRDLQEENAILKKATTIFARGNMKNSDS